MKARLTDHVHRLTEAQYERLLRLIDREQRRIRDKERRDDEDGDNAADEVSSHCRVPACGWVRSAAGRLISLSGR